VLTKIHATNTNTFWKGHQNKNGLECDFNLQKKTAPKCEKANLNAHVERRVASLETLECTFAKQSADTSYNRRIYKIELI
jgi:Zn ribbon nucleic-acid-binding protein